ncbi:fibronectin type III domain-containing protein [Aquimarina mytili]|uniref:Fibronectin type III domain-containing protein n=1 Tax=Aquimarina mytili TaxID=874423 RepID=A0A937A6B8_9FLAO|nr:fibronectin type III domain-containing protein [Aquimarina mytili]MBL0685685.1 fibronectin type III domain-containing protein [Aquimarina mytili]
MKSVKLYIAVIGITLLFSCSGDDDGAVSPGSVSGNEAPVTPSLVFPINNETCTNFDLELDWNIATDPDGDVVSYVVEIAGDNNFNTVVFTTTTTSTQTIFTLEKGTTYYWRVKARDSEGNESAFSEPQSFVTEPDAGLNTIPTVATLVSPSLGATLSGSTVDLEWAASDADGDALSYDLYFGDTNPPILFAENLDTNTINVSVSPDTIYYWRVTVKDTNQGATIGQVWNFRTE